MSREELSEPLSILSRARCGDEALVDDEGALSFAELAEIVLARLRELRRAGLAEGERLGLVGDATRDRVVDVLAALELRAPLVMIHPRSTAREREAILERTRPRLVIHADGRVEPREDGPASQPREAREQREVLAILHTSGTTGTPKAACLSRSAFVAAARASASRFPLGPGERWLLVMPIAHVGGLSVIVRSLVMGSSIAISAPFLAERAVRAVGGLRPVIVSLVPTMLDRMMDEGLEREGLRTILLGGAACPGRVLTRAAARGLPVRTTYGLTEACAQVTTASRDVTSPLEGSGEPLPGTEVRIDADGAIWVRGPTLFEGYLGAPSPFDDERWFETGDLGRFDEEGRLHVLARRRDVVVTGGENVYPAEVEAALERLPGVREACVFGVEDDTWGQRVVAAVVLEPGAAPSGALFEEFVARLRGEVAPFKLPRAFAALEALPRNAAGKLDRDATARLAAPRALLVRG